jgi:hypothetical protein
LDVARAKELLLLHSCGHPDTEHPKWSGGFVGSLNPYRGLNEESFHEVMAAIVAVAPEIVHRPYVDREIVDALWSLSCLTRNWGLHPNGMLQRNGLITSDDIQRLEQWVEAIEWAVTMLLGAADGVPLQDVIDEALASYRQVTGRDFPPGV